MIIEEALQLAGPGAVMVARPRSSALHVYRGPLTRVGLSVPAARRPVCGARTRRLRRVMTLADRTWLRLCRRCARVLGAGRPPRPAPATRQEYLAAYASCTPEQLAHDLEAAQTLEEVDAVAHLTLLLHGHSGCARTRVARPYGNPSLHELVVRARDRVDGEARTAWSQSLGALAIEGYARLKQDRIDAAKDREARVARLGINNVQPNPRRKS